MFIKVLNDVAQLIEHECDALLAEWRAQVRALPQLDVSELMNTLQHAYDLELLRRDQPLITRRVRR